MVTLEVRDDPGKVATGARRTNEKVSQELAEIVEAAEEASNSGPGETARWSYSMPFPGVRYYSFDQRPPKPGE